MKPSILRNLGLAFMGFGLLMGIVFPFYAQFFVEWKEGLRGWFIIGCLIAGLSIGVMNYVLVNTILLRKLRRISEVANAISNKDLSFNCQLVSNDVVGEIAGSFNRMTGNLRQMIGEIGQVATPLADSAGELQLISNDTVRHSSEQQQQTQEVVGAMAHITDIARNISSSAEQATGAASLAEQSSSAGRRVVNDTIRGIDHLAQDIDRASQVINDLESNSNEITSVVEVIREIAEQTNLLALNAAIEAARAGESGRGFAVVADEVRSLASRTQKSTQEIQSMIERLQEGSKNAVAAMQQSQDTARTTVDQATQASSSLDAIMSAVGNIHTLNSGIAETALQQQELAEQVRARIDTISAISDHSVSGNQQINQAGEQLGELSSRLHTYVAEFRT